jgi:hypothetical protein
MSTAEAHYTSVESGPTGIPGFQFVRVSPGLRPALLRRIERLLAYEPPPAMPVRPEPGELADFPVSLSHTRLTADTTVLSRTVYVGRDHSGRYGNYYAHALVLSGPLPPRPLPVDAWASSSWQTGPDGDDGHDTAPSASGPHGFPRTDGAPPPDRLTAFARRHRDRVAAVLTDIRHALEEDGDSRVVLVGSSAEAAHWIALACHSLPADLAEQLTFTTYTRRPDLSPHHVIGVTEDCDLSFADAGARERYRVHRAGAAAGSGTAPLTWAVAAAALWDAGEGESVRAAVAAVGSERSPAERVRALGGALACAALAGGIELPATAVPDAASWCRDRVDEHPRAWWEALISALTARGPLRPEAAQGLATALEERFDPDTTAPLLAAALDALPALLVDEPDDPALREVLRWARVRLAAARDDRVLRAARSGLRKALTREGAPVHVRLELLRLTDTLVQPRLQEEHAARLLVPALLDDTDPRSAAGTATGTRADDGHAGVAAIGALLAEPGQAASRSAVLRALDTRAREDPVPVLRLAAHPDAARLLDPPPPDLRALRAVQRLVAARRDAAAHGRPAGDAASAHDDTAELALVADALAPGGEPDGASVRLALRMVWAGCGPDTGRAARLLRAYPCPEVAEAASALVVGAQRPHRRVTALADLLMDHYLDVFPSWHRPVVELVALTGRLRRVDRGAGTDRVVRRHMELLLSHAGRGPLGEDAARAVVDRVLDPDGFAADDRTFALEFAEFAARATPELAEAYTRRARAALPSVLHGDHRMCAAHAWLWWARGGSPAWEAARGALLDQVLAPALRTLRPALRREACALIGAVDPDTAEQVRSWMEPGTPGRGRPLGIGTVLRRVSPVSARARTDRSAHPAHPARPAHLAPPAPGGPGR